MRAGTLLFLAASLSWAAAQDTAVCTASGLLSCVGAPLSATCTDRPCACSQVQAQTACYTSLCSGTPIPTGVLDAYTNACGAGGSGGSVAATTTSAGAAGGTTAPASTTTAMGTATAGQTAATSKAAANAGFVVPVGGVLGAALGMVAFL